jgi:hypothetical protein
MAGCRDELRAVSQYHAGQAILAVDGEIDAEGEEDKEWQ